MPKKKKKDELHVLQTIPLSPRWREESCVWHALDFEEDGVYHQLDELPNIGIIELHDGDETIVINTLDLMKDE